MSKVSLFPYYIVFIKITGYLKTICKLELPASRGGPGDQLLQLRALARGLSQDLGDDG